VNVALKYSDRILGVNRGKIVFDGSPDELSSEHISGIYGSESRDLIVDLGEERHANLPRNLWVAKANNANATI
ncbi:MAG TPA: hypothetical protein VJ955_07600, partial [Desulfuromonadales bacterium]|nr:hypothetical protein [Desulfuromonadales bacterium]